MCQGILRRASTRGKELPGDSEAGIGTPESTAKPILCLNDQNTTEDVSENQTLTPKAHSNGHQPCVLHAAGCIEHSANSRSIGYGEEVSPTLRAGVVPAALSVENHPADGRVRISVDGKSQILTNRIGTGGVNVPLVAELEIKNIAFGLCSKSSHSMFSDNPHSRSFYEAQTARTLDRGGGLPLCNQEAESPSSPFKAP